MKLFLLSIILFLAPLLVSSISQVSTQTFPGDTFIKVDLGGTVQAAETPKKKKKKKKDTRKKRKVPPIREKTYRVLEESQMLIDPSKVPPKKPGDPPLDIPANPAKALEVLKKAKERSGLNSYEVAQLWNTMAYAYFTLEDIPNTLKAYKEVLKGKIPIGVELLTLRSLFQIYLMEEDYDNSLSYIAKWEAVNIDPDPDVIYFKGYISMAKENFRKALGYALKVERVAKAQEKKMKENWWYLQVMLYTQKKDYNNVIPVLEKLVVNYPKKQYWIHLIGMYSEKDRPDDALSAAYAAYTQDMFIKESELVVLAQRLLNAEVPYEASQVVATGLKKGYIEESQKVMKLLAQSYTMAREMDKAIVAWEKASTYAKDGQIYFRLAQALSNEDRHKEAIAAYRNALKKGKLDKPADVSFWMGISLMQVQEWDKAIDAFNKTAELDEKQAKRCEQYIAYINSEKHRLQKIQEMLDA